MFTQFKRSIAAFGRDEKGNVTVEAMIVFPTLLVLFAVSWVYFDVMRQQSINQKANYTISDIVSRETEIINEGYIDNARKLLHHLTKSQGDDADLRISVIQYNHNGNSNNGSYDLVWSKARGDWAPLQQASLAVYQPRLPILASGDQTIIVETRDWYIPTFQPIGLDSFDISTYSFTRPRFAPQVIFEGINDGSDKVWGNNGWGNGDQDAPGGSLCNNNAENQSNCDGSSDKGNGKGNKNSS
jgi:hypothetical protein